MNTELPKQKDEIVFDEVFINKIKFDGKAASIRNSPVSLGYKKIDDELTIEIMSCEKFYFDLDDEEEMLYGKNHFDLMYCRLSQFNKMGFSNNKEMFDYYKSYLKRDFAYIVTFDVINKFERVTK